MMLRRAAFYSTSLVFTVCALLGYFPSPSLAQLPQPRERLRGVVLRVKLPPELHGNTTIRFSPDGKALFIQDAAGITLVSREPLQLVARISGLYAYPARFSSDSQTLTLVTFDLSMSRWRVSDGKQLESRALKIPSGCLSASLSAGGDLLGCYTPNFDFVLYRLDSDQKIFSTSIHIPPSGQTFVPIPLENDIYFSAPFGYIVSHDLQPLVNRGLLHHPIWFSPDGKFVIAGDDTSGIRVNLATLTKESLPSEIHHRMRSISGVTLDEQVLLLDPTKPDLPSLASLSNAKSTPLSGVSGEFAELCSDSRHAIFRASPISAIRIVDLQLSHPPLVSNSLAADIHGDEVAALTRENILQFFRMGESKPLTAVRLPVGLIPPLRAANVDDSLTILSVAIEGAGAAFDVASGKVLFQQPSFAGVNLQDARHPLFLFARKAKMAHRVVRGDAQTQTTQPAWTAQETAELHQSQTSFIEYSLATNGSGRIPISEDFSSFQYHLRGLDPATGAQLWLHRYEEDSPVPFSDPQGDRIVLGWKAKSLGARNAIKDNPAVRETYNHTKRMGQDSVFEVLDARTGKSIAAALVQFGDGPLNFSSAFSVGNFLFLEKDDIRLSVISLTDGRVIVRAKGASPSANGQSNLFSLDEGFGRLGVYDSLTGAKLEEQLFPERLAYAHFSADGKRLLVLTQNQELFILDMSEVREHPLVPQHQTPDSSAEPVDQPQ
ncbi:MAG TPA: hypothetical protein VN025_11325 [Candidatus Dormibacteraeota bacterium]|jgi:hypothetical protein|nr:hypothetical protein [Candidatus Dormibacteraeota bacterium]